ncbi:MAG: Crp/Fnr family transcriptional regulator, partial [Chitinispirillaceae bacterium]|nr:Crp/Fnr family transcriptional regulator [Chitinispirillaceae bacterium]
MVIGERISSLSEQQLQEGEELLAAVPLFANLSSSERKAIREIMILRNYKAGECIVNENEESQTFFIILSGSVNVTVSCGREKQAILATLQKGEFFGEMALLDGEPRSASVFAAESCKLLMLYRKYFLDILMRYPKISISMLSEMSKRLRRSNKHINTLSMMRTYGRVAETLLQLAKEKGKIIGNTIIIDQKPPNNIIAKMAGTTRETVSRILSQLQKKHYIKCDRKRVI